MTLANRIAELARPLPRFAGIPLAIALVGPLAAQADPDTLSLIPGTVFRYCPVCPGVGVCGAGGDSLGTVLGRNGIGSSVGMPTDPWQRARMGG